MHSTLARMRQRVPTVARLDQRVGPELDADAGGDDLVDHGCVGPRVEVVDELGALVAQEPGVLEPGRALHGGHDTRADTERLNDTRNEGAPQRSLVAVDCD